MKIGDEVIYIKKMAGLPKDSIGVVSGIISDDMVSVTYPQFAPIENNGKYIYSNNVYQHSALISELKPKP